MLPDIVQLWTTTLRLSWSQATSGVAQSRRDGEAVLDVISVPGFSTIYCFYYYSFLKGVPERGLGEVAEVPGKVRRAEGEEGQEAPGGGGSGLI